MIDGYLMLKVREIVKTACDLLDSEFILVEATVPTKEGIYRGL